MGELSDRVKQTQPATPRERCERWARQAVEAEHRVNYSRAVAMTQVLDDAQRENVLRALDAYDSKRVTRWPVASAAWYQALTENRRALDRIVQHIMGVVR